VYWFCFMKKRVSFYAAMATIALVFCPQLSALPFVEARPLYVGSRALGMGNAFTAIADEGEAGFWNPAGLVQWQGAKLFASMKASDREGYAFDSKSMAYCYRDVGFSWGNKIVVRDAEGESSDYTYYSLARKLTPYLALGSSVKFRRKHPCEYYQFFGHTPGYDVGVLWKPNSANSGGVLIQNMGGAREWISVITLGFAHRFLSSWLLSLDLAALFGDDTSLEPRLGCEWQMSRWVALRAGVSNGDPAAGVGLRLSRIRIDYAWIHNERGNAHFLSGQMEF